MFLPIDVKIEVGEYISGFSSPYIDPVDKRSKVDKVLGLVEGVDHEKEFVVVYKYPRKIAFYRIETFTFGGVELHHDKFDHMRVWKENMAKI